MLKRTLALLAAAAIAAPAAAQMKPASDENIQQAVEACEEITSPTWIDVDKLRGALGWATLRRKSGRQTEAFTGAYTHPDNDALIIAGRDELQSHTCVVVARLKDTSQYHPTAQAASAWLGAPEKREGNTYYWTVGSTHVRLDPAGERSAPNARFEVSASKEDSE